MAPVSLSFCSFELDNDCRLAQFRMCLPVCVMISAIVIVAHLISRNLEAWWSKQPQFTGGSPGALGGDSRNASETALDLPLPVKEVLYTDLGIIMPNLCSLSTNLFLWKVPPTPAAPLPQPPSPLAPSHPPPLAPAPFLAPLPPHPSP